MAAWVVLKELERVKCMMCVGRDRCALLYNNSSSSSSSSDLKVDRRRVSWV